MKKIYTAIVAMIIASLVFVLSGCELAIDLGDKTPEDTQSHTAIVEVTDEQGQVVATEMVTISDAEMEKAENFFENDKKSDKAETGVLTERIEEAIDKNKVTTTVAGNSGNNTKPTQSQSSNGNLTNTTTSKQNGGSNSNVNNNENQYVQDDAAVISSTQYMLTGRQVSTDGKVTPYKIARSGSKMAIFTEFEGQEIGIVVNDNAVLMLSVSEKTYVEISKDVMKENMSEEDMAMLDGSSLNVDKVVKETTTEKADGVDYTVIIYENGQKDYLIGKTIIKSVYTDNSVLYYDSVSAVVPSSIFSAPSGYKKTTLDEEGVSDFVGAMDITEAHNHDE